jgi:hypothetical protein
MSPTSKDLISSAYAKGVVKTAYAYHPFGVKRTEYRFFFNIQRVSEGLAD